MANHTLLIVGGTLQQGGAERIISVLSENETDGVVQKVCEAVKAGRCPFFFGSVQYVVFGKSGRDGNTGIYSQSQRSAL